MANQLIISCVLMLSSVPMCQTMVIQRPEPVATTHNLVAATTNVAEETSEVVPTAPEVYREGRGVAFMKAGFAEVREAYRKHKAKHAARGSEVASAKPKLAQIEGETNVNQTSAKMENPGWSWQPINPYGYWQYGSSGCFLESGCQPAITDLLAGMMAFRQDSEAVTEVKKAEQPIGESIKELRKAEQGAPAEIYADNYWRIQIPCNTKCSNFLGGEAGWNCNDMTLETRGFDKNGKVRSSKVKHAGIFLRDSKKKGDEKFDLLQTQDKETEDPFWGFSAAIGTVFVRGECKMGIPALVTQPGHRNILIMDEDAFLRQNKCTWKMNVFRKSFHLGGVSSKGPADHTCALAGLMGFGMMPLNVMR